MTRSGIFEVTVEPGEMPAKKLDALRSVVDSFVGALAAGCFGRGRVRRATADKHAVYYEIEAKEVPDYAFRVLSGMLTAFHRAQHPLLSFRARGPDAPFLDLCETRERFPERAPTYPFVVASWLDERALTPRMAAEIEFLEAPSPSQREELTRDLWYFDRLLQGGYAAKWGRHGEASTSGTSVSFASDKLLRYGADMWHAGHEAFVALFDLASCWHRCGMQVTTIDIRG